MATRLFLLLFFISGCGSEVKLGTNKLESTQQLTDADIRRYQKAGTLNRGSTDTVTYGGQNYPVSIYSSMSAQNFIKALPQGSQVPIIFTGATNRNEIVLETVERQ